MVFCMFTRGRRGYLILIVSVHGSRALSGRSTTPRNCSHGCKLLMFHCRTNIQYVTIIYIYNYIYIYYDKPIYTIVYAMYIYIYMISKVCWIESFVWLLLFYACFVWLGTRLQTRRSTDLRGRAGLQQPNPPNPGDRLVI